LNFSKLIIILFLTSFTSEACVLSKDSYKSITHIYENINAVTKFKYVLKDNETWDGKAKATKLHGKLLSLSYVSPISEQGAFIFSLDYLTGDIYLHHSNKAQTFQTEYLKGKVDIASCKITFTKSAKNQYHINFKDRGFNFIAESIERDDIGFKERLRFEFY
jgi:hypothetical protein